MTPKEKQETETTEIEEIQEQAPMEAPEIQLTEEEKEEL
jgi:hypothetical protein